MTAAEYLAWEPTQEGRHEYWDGKVIDISGETRSHNRICLNFFKILDDGLLDSSYDVYIIDVKVQVEPGRKYFYPDVVVTCDDGDDDRQYVGSPCLIIEVLSPSTEAIDRGAKFAKYRQFLAFKEYVLVNASEPKVEVFRRNDKGQWVLSEYNLEDTLHLESIDVEIAVVDLYRQVKFEIE